MFGSCFLNASSHPCFRLFLNKIIILLLLLLLLLLLYLVDFVESASCSLLLFCVVSTFHTLKTDTFSACSVSCFGVSIIHRTLTSTTGSLTCESDLFACVDTRGTSVYSLYPKDFCRVCPEFETEKSQGGRKA